MCSFRFSFVLLLFSIVATGCGRNVNLSIRAADSEKSSAAADVASQIQLTYRDNNGAELLNERFPIAGLGQGKIFNPKIDKKFAWDKDGTFEARAFASDGVELLRGKTKADPEQTNDVTIELVRTEDIKRTSAVVRGVELTVPKAQTTVELDGLKKHAVQGQCERLQTVEIPQSGANFPVVTLKTVVKATDLKWTPGFMDANGVVQRWGDTKSLSILENGYPGIEFGPRFESGLLLKEPTNMTIKIQSSEYEGCIRIQTVPEMTPVAIAVNVDDRYPVDTANRPGFHRFTNVVRFVATNPNPYDIALVWEGQTLGQMYFFPNIDTLNRGAGIMTPPGQMSVQTLTLKANSSSDWYVYGAAVIPDHSSYHTADRFGIKLPPIPVIDLRLSWSGSVKPVWYKGSPAPVPGGLFHTRGN